jgi:hypothetical protein
MSGRKKIVSGVIVVLAVAALTVTVVIVVARTHNPNVAGLYSAQDGREIRIAKDGTLTEAGLPSIGIARRTPLPYWVRGNSIIVGREKVKSPGNAPVAFKVQKDGRLVGWGTVWRKYTVEPNRPLSLVGTYTSVSGDGETLALDRNGAVYVTQPLPTGETVGGGIWVAGKDTVTVTYPVPQRNTNKTVYSVQGGNLTGGGKQLTRTSNRAIVPATL